MAAVNILSELNAIVLKIAVANGDRVDADQELIILESMKTEIPVASPRAGSVKEILVTEGELVAERQPLLILES